MAIRTVSILRAVIMIFVPFAVGYSLSGILVAFILWNKPLNMVEEFTFPIAGGAISIAITNLYFRQHRKIEDRRLR